ncbi:MAG: NUDIX hydrolase [Ketobacter sp.]|nr:MAG: NUDIX hydrolase [Ketobacter sp.]
MPSMPNRGSETKPLKHQAVPIQPAATIVLLRDSDQGPQILMQQRNPEAIFVGGAWVFPGGKLDPHDEASAWLEYCDLPPDAANRLLELEAHGHAYWIAAIRELVEEAGILLAEGATPQLAARAQQFLQQEPSGFLDFCSRNGLQLQTGKLRYLSRWITPPGTPRRYDTRFFLCPWPEGQPPRQDDHEAVNTGWFTATQALTRYEKGDWDLVLPTIMTLRHLSRYNNVQELLQQEGQAAHNKTG